MHFIKTTPNCKIFNSSKTTFKTTTNRWLFFSLERFGDNSKNYFLSLEGFTFLITNNGLQKMALFQSILAKTN